MKFASKARWILWRGFTLVELLVVITIIALLAGLILPAIIGAIGKAEKQKAAGEVQAIAAAVEHYLNEYGKFPGQTAGNSDHQYSVSEYPQLIAALQGSNFMWNGANANPRGAPYLSVDQKSIVTNATGNASKGMLADPWGNRYEVVADWNFDNSITTVNADGERVFNHSVAVWSYGPSAKVTQNANDSTHIRSWK